MKIPPEVERLPGVFECVDSREVYIVLEGGFVGDGVGVKVLGPFRNVSESPVPEGEHYEVFGDAGFCFGGGLGEDDFADDAFTEGKNTEEVGMEEHAVTKVTKFLVYIECLRCHVYFDMIMALEFEEVTNTRLEYLIVTVIPNHANFVQQQQGSGFRYEVAEMLNIEMTNTGHAQLVHVGIDNPTTL